MGFAFGLFAVRILRYRTNPIPIKEMTYLFIVITIGVINSLGGSTVDISVLIQYDSYFNGIFIENYWQNNNLITRSIRYKKMENLKPENHDKLLIDLKDSTGLDIESFEIKRMNLDTSARIKIYSKD